MKKTLLFSALILSATSSFAQHQTDTWYFGTNAGISFSGGTPVALEGSPMNTEGCASISDKTSGSILFYTDGVSVWNKEKNIMPNGSGLAGGISTQSAMIVPLPQSDSLYYVFTNGAMTDSTGLQYSIVDMSLDSGRGDVVLKNIFVRNGLTEKLTAVANSQGDGYWIGVHEFGTDTFYTYRLLSTGFDTVPVISRAGIIHSLQSAGNGYGQMKFSPCGNRIACAVGYLDTLEVFDFDDATGIISNPIPIPMPAHVFGVEFSPDGRKIYVSTYSSATLYQFDLSSGDPAIIVQTHTALSIQPDTYGLQLASDGKIYVAKSFSSWLGAITDPNVAGPSCNYVDTALFLDPLSMGNSSGLCLPGFVQSYFKDIALCSGTNIPEQENKIQLLYPNPSNSEFNIKLDGESNIRVFDVQGKIIEEIITSQQNYSFGKNYDAGLFFVRLSDKDGIRIYKALKY